MYPSLGKLRNVLDDIPGVLEFLGAVDGVDLALLDKIYLQSLFDNENEEFCLSLAVAFEGELVVPFPGTDIFSLVLGSNMPGYTFVNTSWIIANPSRFGLHDLQVTLRIHHALLKPVVLEPGDPTDWVAAKIEGSLIIDSDINIYPLLGPFSISPFEIGNSGLIVGLRECQLDFSSESTPAEIMALGYDESFKGVYAKEATLYCLAGSFFQGQNGLRVDFNDVALGQEGVSFKTTLTPMPALEGYLFDPAWSIALNKIEAEISHNWPTRFSITGKVGVPILSSHFLLEFGLRDLGEMHFSTSMALQSEGSIHLDFDMGYLDIEQLKLSGTLADDRLSLEGALQGLRLNIDLFDLSIPEATASISHDPTNDALSIELKHVPFGALGTVELAKLVLATSTDEAGATRTEATMECEVAWSDVRDRLHIPAAFPAPPEDGTVKAKLRWVEGRSGERLVVLHLETKLNHAEQLWPFVPESVRPEVRRFALTADITYTSGSDAGSAATTGKLAGSGGSQAAIAAAIELRVPPLPTVPGSELLHIHTGDADGWISATLTVAHRADGTDALAFSVTNPIAIGLDFPKMQSAEPPVRLALTTVDIEVTDAASGAGAFTLAGTFKLHPVMPPLDLPIGEQLGDLFAGFALSDLEGHCSLKLAFKGDKAALMLDAEFAQATVEVRVFQFLESVARGVSTPAEAAVQEVPIDIDVGVGLKGIRFQLGTLVDTPHAPTVEVEITTSMHVGDVEGEGSLKLSDVEVSIGLARLDVPLRLPRFPLRPADLDGCYGQEQPLWDERLGEWRVRRHALETISGRDATREANEIGARIALVEGILPLRDRIGATASTPSDRSAARLRFDNELRVVLDGLAAATGLWTPKSDVKLRLENARFRVPFQNPRNFGVEGSIHLTGFAADDPLKPLETVTLTLGLSADLIYAGLEMTQAIAFPAFGRYDGGSVQIGKLMLGFGYTRSSLAIAFDGSLVLPPRLIEDADTSSRLGVGIVLPHRSRLYFRFELIPVPVVKVVPYFEFNLDLRDTYSPALDDVARCIPHWDGLQLHVPGLVRVCMKHLSFSPMFGPLVAPNYHQAYALDVGTSKNGITNVVDDALTITGVMTSTMIMIPYFADGTPFSDHYAENIRLAGFELNYDLQRPFPSLDPLALFEAMALMADPLMHIDPNGRLANTMRISLKNVRLVLPPEVRAIFPWAAEITRLQGDYTVNIETILTPLQHLAGLAKQTFDQLTAGGTLEERLAALRAHPPIPDVGMVLAALPPAMRVQQFQASFAGFCGRAVVALIQRKEAAAELASVPVDRRPPPVLSDAVFSNFTAEDLASLPPREHGAGVIVGAELSVLSQHYSFLGQLYEDGAFALVSRAKIDPLRLSVVGIAAEIPLALHGRLVLAGQPGPSGIVGTVQADGYASWDALPGVLKLTIGTKDKPASLRVRSDGRFALVAGGEAELFGGAIMMSAGIGLSENHCLLEGSASASIQQLFALTVSGSGVVGPGEHFTFAGSAIASVLGHALKEARATISDHGATVEGTLDVGAWAVGKTMIGAALHVDVKGELGFAAGAVTAVRLTGMGSLSLPALGPLPGPSVTGRALLAIEPGHPRLEMEGTLDWMGARWTGGRVVLSSDAIEASGTATLVFVLAPGTVAGIGVAELVVRTHLETTIRVNGHGALVSWELVGDAAVGLRLPNQEQIVPLAMARIAPCSGGSTLRIPLLRVAGLGAVPSVLPTTLPIPVGSFNPTTSTIKIPGSFLLDPGSVNFNPSPHWDPPSLTVTWNEALDVVTGGTVTVRWDSSGGISLEGFAIPTFTVYLIWTGRGFQIAPLPS